MFICTVWAIECKGHIERCAPCFCVITPKGVKVAKKKNKDNSVNNEITHIGIDVCKNGFSLLVYRNGSDDERYVLPSANTLLNFLERQLPDPRGEI